jgi:hypothetical protein
VFGLSTEEGSEVGVELEEVIRCELRSEDATFVMLVVFTRKFRWGKVAHTF